MVFLAVGGGDGYEGGGGASCCYVGVVAGIGRGRCCSITIDGVNDAHVGIIVIGGGLPLLSMVMWESVGLSTRDGANIVGVCSRTSSLWVHSFQNCRRDKDSVLIMHFIKAFGADKVINIALQYTTNSLKKQS